MAVFRKIILRPGTYKAKTPKGDTVLAPVTPTYIKSLHDTATKMLEAGFKIPAPFAHKDANNEVPMPLGDKEDQKWSADINGGFWKSFEITPKGEFAGYVEAPGDPDDLNTPAGKIGKTVQETSVWVVPEWKDGIGRTWDKALYHVALCTNPVEPNQTNFELIKDADYSLAMSFSMADEIGGSYGQNSSKDSSTSPSSSPKNDSNKQENATDKNSSSGSKISEIISLLREKLQIDLPSDTSDENFCDRLRTVLYSFPTEETDEENDEKLTKKPEGSEVQSSPIAMANDNPDNVVLMQNKANKLLEKMLGVLKKSLVDRINAAVEAGKIGKKYAETHLLPQVDALVMSYDAMDDEGNFPKSEVEIRLEMAEDMESLLGKEESGHIPDAPNDVDGSIPTMTKEEKEAVYSFLY